MGAAWVGVGGSVCVCRGCGVAYLLPPGVDPPPGCPACEREEMPVLLHRGEVRLLIALNGIGLVDHLIDPKRYRAAVRRTRPGQPEG